MQKSQNCPNVYNKIPEDVTRELGIAHGGALRTATEVASTALLQPQNSPNSCLLQQHTLAQAADNLDADDHHNNNDDNDDDDERHNDECSASQHGNAYDDANSVSQDENDEDSMQVEVCDENCVTKDDENYVVPQNVPTQTQHTVQKQTTENPVLQAIAITHHEQKNLAQKQESYQVLQSLDQALEYAAAFANGFARRDLYSVYEASYGNQYDTLLLQQEVSTEGQLNATFIDPKVRTRMVDWMLEVYACYSRTTLPQTFHRAVHLMDAFLKKSVRTLENKDIHLIGIACIFIASKTEDIYALSMNEVLERLAKGFFTRQQIKEIEFEILQTLNFDVSNPTPYDFFVRYHAKLFGKDSQNHLAQRTLATGILLLKLAAHSEQLSGALPHELAAGALFFSLRVHFVQACEDLALGDELYKYQEKMLKIQTSLLSFVPQQSVDSVQWYAQQLEEYLNVFDQMHPKCESLRKYH